MAAMYGSRETDLVVKYCDLAFGISGPAAAGPTPAVGSVLFNR